MWRVPSLIPRLSSLRTWASDGVILTGVQRSSLARIDRVCGGEPGDETRES